MLRLVGALKRLKRARIIRGRIIRGWLGLRAGIAEPDALAVRVDERAFAERKARVYDPEADLYGTVNPIGAAKMQFLRFAETMRNEGATLTVDARAYDGAREVLHLNAAETAAYVSCVSLEERLRYRTAHIRERRLVLAREGAQAIHAGVLLESLPSRQEAALREFGALEADGDAVRLREDSSWDTADVLNTPYLDQEYLPYGQGPLGYQLYLADMWDQLAKAWWAWHHDPLAKQGVNIIVTFVLAGGVQVVCEDERTQAVVDEFWAREAMDLRLRAWLTDLGRDGEVFVHLIPDGTGKLRARSLDPTTIWEIVTDAVDIEKVYAYAQRYMTRTQLVTLEGIDSQKWVERDLSPRDVIHVRVNATSSEVRGRSDLFAVLGYLKRLRDYFSSEVLKAQAAAAYHRDITIDGSDTDVQAFAAAESQQGAPQPGESWYHNKSVEISMVQGGNRTPASNGSVYAGLVNLIACGLGISKEFLGVTEHASLASAEVSTDPAFQSFEVRQQLTRDMLERVLRSVIAEAQRYGRIPNDTSTVVAISFRGIRHEDKTKKIERLAIGEGMDWWSKRTAAEAAALEADLGDYNFDDEQTKIADEGNGAVILKTYEQVPKGPPQLSQAAFAPSMVPNPNAAAKPAASNGKTEARERGIVIIP